jgi:RHS repeat-associated protein
VTNVYDFKIHLIQHGGITYTYDGDGNRLTKTIGKTRWSYHNDNAINPTGYVQVFNEYSTNLTTNQRTFVNEYIYGPMREAQNLASQPLCYWWGCIAQVRYYGYDGHGSTRLLTDVNGNGIDTYDYVAYGNLVASTGTDFNQFLFAGEQYDSDLGLYYNRARYLDVRVGRFWGMDTWEGNKYEPISQSREDFRAAAARGLRLIPGDAIDALLASTAKDDASAKVRGSALFAISFRLSLSNTLWDAVLNAARSDSSESVRNRAISLLRNDASRRHETENTLQWIAEHDPVEGLRNVARDSLAEIRANPSRR